MGADIVFRAENDKTIWIIIGGGVMILAGMRKYIRIVNAVPETAANYEAMRRLSNTLLILCMLVIIALGAFIMWCIYVRPRCVIVDAPGHCVYLISVWFTWDYSIGMLRLYCPKRSGYGFLLGFTFIRLCPSIYVLPFKGQTLRDFAWALEEAGGWVPCDRCEKPCAPAPTKQCETR